MGCHTWFARPVTEDEFELMKEYAPIQIFEAIGDTKENNELEIFDDVRYRLLMKSYEKNVPCVYGKYWWQLGWGSQNPLLGWGDNNYAHQVRGEQGLYVDVPGYHDVFRVKNYPLKVIHCRRELRRWMGKKYFDLEEWQLEKISEFFQRYSGGVIIFG